MIMIAMGMLMQYILFMRAMERRQVEVQMQYGLMLGHFGQQKRLMGKLFLVTHVPLNIEEIVERILPVLVLFAMNLDMCLVPLIIMIQITKMVESLLELVSGI